MSAFLGDRLSGLTWLVEGAAAGAPVLVSSAAGSAATTRSDFCVTCSLLLEGTQLLDVPGCAAFTLGPVTTSPKCCKKRQSTIEHLVLSHV